MNNDERTETGLRIVFMMKGKMDHCDLAVKSPWTMSSEHEVLQGKSFDFLKRRGRRAVKNIDGLT